MLTVIPIDVAVVHDLSLAIVAAEVCGETFSIRRRLHRLERGELSVSDAACRLRLLLGHGASRRRAVGPGRTAS
jgi:hypothetical protein